jgi:hypothetical protein
MHKLKALLHPTFALVYGLLGSACVDQFEGANIQIDFGGGVPAQVRQGAAPQAGNVQLPTNTHYKLYGFRELRNSAGVVTGEVVATELQRFEIHRIVEPASPCFIDPEEARFPGLHVTRYAERMQVETGISDIKNPPVGATEEDKIDMATALQRQINVGGLGREPLIIPPPVPPGMMSDPGGLKAVTSVSVGGYPAVGTQCVEENPQLDRDLIPPARCIEDESNKLRLEVCNRAWAANPGLYEGTDRVLTEPLAGEFFGIVLGVNRINGAVLGGSQFFVKDPALGYDFYSVYIQFDDANGDGAPDVPAFPGLGLQLLTGRPTSPTRGVTRVGLVGPAGLSSNLAIFSDLGGDDVHF